jgi:hypothetical protein
LGGAKHPLSVLSDSIDTMRPRLLIVMFDSAQNFPNGERIIRVNLKPRKDCRSSISAEPEIPS